MDLDCLPYSKFAFFLCFSLGQIGILFIGSSRFTHSPSFLCDYSKCFYENDADDGGEGPDCDAEGDWDALL